MLKYVRATVLIALALSLFAACGAEPSLTLNRNGSGRFDLKLKLAQPFVDYLLDLGEAAGTFKSREQAVIFDLKTIEKKLASYPGVKVLILKATPGGELSLSLAFQDVSVFVAPGELWPKGSPLSYTSSGSQKTLRLRFDETALRKIISSFFNFKATELESFLPRVGESRKEYEENLDFALEGGAKLFNASLISFQVRVEGEILEHNGTLKNKNTVAFTVPLASVLFLNQPLDYSITFQ
jgi:hypothetical protein